MHLKFEGNWVYAMLIPAGILAIILTCALIPDVAMQPVTEESREEEESTPLSLLETGVVRLCSAVKVSGPWTRLIALGILSSRRYSSRRCLPGLRLVPCGAEPPPGRGSRRPPSSNSGIPPDRAVGPTMGEADLAGRVWVASFIFTHCPLSCPRITSVMKGLQARLAGARSTREHLGRP